MNSVLFICHRPYHYFVSAIIAKQNKLKYPRSTHYCINFDVYTFKTNNKKVDYSKNCKLSKYDTLLSDKSIFNETYWLSRKNEKGIWNIVKFYKYYNDTVDDFKRLIANFSSCDNLYIFSDKEKPVEILSLLMIERFQPKVYLFDEGVVSYNYKNNYSKMIIKWLIVHLFRLKYIGDNYNYGESKIFDFFITFDRKKIAIPIKKEILEIKPLDFSILKPYIKIQLPEFNRKSVLYISTPISEVSYNKEKEILQIRKIVKYWEKLGYIVLLKMHPLEEKDKFKALRSESGISIIENKNIPPEIFYDDLKIITGLFSSSLLNASRFSNKIIISYNIIFNWNNNAPIFQLGGKHGINFVSDLTDIKNIIKSPKKYYTLNSNS